MDRVMYKLLKQLYKRDLTGDEINEIISKKLNKSFEYVEKLERGRFIVRNEINSAVSTKISYSITVEGRAYLEDRKRRILSSWIPYGITTLIAFGNLVALIISLCR